MRTDWKRSMAVLLATGGIALTAACGAEVSGAVQGGVPAVAGTESAQQTTTTAETTTDESSEEVGTTGSEEEPATSAEPTSAEPTSAEPTTSPEPTSDSGEPGGDTALPPVASSSTPTSSPGGASPAVPTESSSSTSAQDYAFTKDYCTLMPKSAITGLQKDTTRKPDLACTYTTPDSAKNLRIVTVTGGFDLSYEDLDESYNVDLARVKIDGRDGFTWTNSSKSLYSALFNLPAPEGRKMSIMVIITDDSKSLAEKKKEALAIAAVVSKDVPR